MDSGALPRIFGDFRFEREAGRGAMGVVYEAEQLSTGRRCAVKLLKHGLAPDEEAVERFRREGQVAGSIAHPCTVFVYAADEVDGTPFIAMEWMPGGTLKEHVEKHGPMPVTAAVDCTLHVLDGLVAAADAGVVHRDVKPSNCFLDSDGSVKVGDFGLAKSLRAGFDLTMTGEFIGTPYFASPEQVRGRDLGPRSDQYSLAATLFYLLTARPMFPGTHAGDVLGAIVSDAPPSVRSFRKDVPVGLGRVIRKALSKNPTDRYVDFDAFRRALRPYATQVLAPAARGPRLAAWLADAGLVAFAAGALAQLAGAVAWLPDVRNAPIHCLGTLLWFTLFEGFMGRTPGKALLGLAVGRRPHGPGSDSPVLSLTVAMRRTLLYMLCLSLGVLLPSLDALPDGAGRVWWSETDWWELGTGTASGALLILSTMRRRNGWRGPHELLSRTFVYHRAAEEAAARRKPASSAPLTCLPDTELPAQLGSFSIRGVLGRHVEGAGHAGHAAPVGSASAAAPADVLLLGHDPSLGRAAWIVLRPSGSAPLPASRRDLRRAPRLRWLGGGLGVSGRWDAFEAPEGGPLSEFVRRHGALPWTEARGILLALAEELSRAAREGTLPASLSLAHVWLTPSGRVRLLDTLPDHPLPPDEESGGRVDVPAAFSLGGSAASVPQALPAELERALLAFLAAVAVTAVAPPQRKQRVGGLPDPRRLPLPRHAADVLVALRDNSSLGLDGAIEQLTKLTRRTASATRGMRVLETLPALLFIAAMLLVGVAVSSRGLATDLELSAAIVDEAPDVVEPGESVRAAAEAASTLLAASTLDDLRREGLVSSPDDGGRSLVAVLGGVTWSEHEAAGRLAEAQEAHPAPTSIERERATQVIAALRTRMQHVLVAGLLGAAVALLGLLGALSGFVARGNPILDLIGVDVHTRDHGRAGRLRCALRGGVPWLLIGGAQLGVLVWVAFLIPHVAGGHGLLSVIGFASTGPVLTSDIFLLLSVLVLLGVFALPLWKPRVSVQDWIARTQLLPR